jgi:adenylate kinase
MSGKRVTIRNSPYLINSNKPMPKKVVFLNNVNSYTGRNILRKLLKLHEENDENLWYEVFGTLNKREELTDDVRKVLVLHAEDDSFFNSVSSCDIIIYDITQNFIEAKKFFKYFENELENSRVVKKKQIILISTIMTWAMTHNHHSAVMMTDSNHRRRRPHPCFTREFALERDVMNLAKKYKKLVTSVVVCPGIVYGEKQDILHFVYKKCYFNHVQVNIFAPGTNYLPVIYIEDFSRIMMDLIKNEPGADHPYILAVQPEPIDAFNLISVLSESVGGSETRINISNREDIFTMDEAVMTVN